MNKSNKGLWITIIVEAVMIILVGLYNMYEVRRISNNLNNKIEHLAEFSSAQGKKIDRILTSFESYSESQIPGATITIDETVQTNSEKRIDAAINFLERYKTKKEELQQEKFENNP